MRNCLKYINTFKLISLSLFFFILFLLNPQRTLALPANFSSSPLIDNGLTTPTAFVIASDGRIFIAEKSGSVKIYKNGTLVSTPFVQLPANSDGERGLLGIALDPDFASNKYIYFNYTGQDFVNHVVRYSAAADIASDGPIKILDVPLSQSLIHVGGTIGFGKEGKLYMSIGDNGSRDNAQNLNSLTGKILRVNSDGTIPSDNPFFGQSGKRGEIWAYGFRNPFRFQFDSNTGELFLGDVGENTWEEVNKVEKGQNYGWPLQEGNCSSNCGSFINPVYAYQHLSGQGASITGGPVYQGSNFPAQYQGKYFFSDYVNGFIKYLDFGGGSASEFEPNAGSVVDMKVGPDGQFYYLTIYPGKLFKVSYTSTNQNQPPTATINADKTSGGTPLTIQFSSQGSSDPEGQPLTYIWDFGDNTTSNEANPAKTFSTPGTYLVKLKLSDGQNEVSSQTLTIKAGIEPVVEISVPVNNSKYNAGDTISYSASAKDGEGNTIPEASIETQVIFHHNDHIHPFLTEAGKQAGTFKIPTTGHTAVDTWYEIKITAKDSNNLSSSKSVFIYPNTVEFTVTSDPVGLKVYVDSLPVTTPQIIKGVRGFEHEINAPETQDFNGGIYNFDRWSNGGPMRQRVDTDLSNQTYTAYFSKSVNFSAEYFNNAYLSGEAALKRTEKSIYYDWGNASPDASINSDYFSARWVGSQDFKAGKYKFKIGGDDGLRLYVDGVLLINEWKGQPYTEYTKEIDLSEGVHEIMLEYFEAAGGASAKLSWEKTGDVTANFYKASYFNKRDLSGASVFQRDEIGINNNWQWGSPHSSVNSDQFSARFLGRNIFENGFYKFIVTADDGVRVFVDNEKIIDKWVDQSTATYATEKYMTAGNHDIKVEYYENTGAANVKLSFIKIPDESLEWEAEYFNNTNLSGSPVLTKTYPQLNFDWWINPPEPGVTANNFSARFIKNQFFNAGNYSFTLKADDGVRFWVDNILVIDDWSDHPVKTYTPSVYLAAGPHKLKVEFYERSGDAVISILQN